MMNEKRFFTTLANEEYTLIQKKGNPRSTYLKYSEVVDLLNKLYEENEKLRQRNRRLYKCALYGKTIGDETNTKGAKNDII